jgi:putative redox protein
MSPPTRVYKTDEVTVEWRPELCIHCQACITGLPEVFDMAKRPWVNISGASADKIRRQVGECPSKALSLGGAA